MNYTEVFEMIMGSIGAATIISLVSLILMVYKMNARLAVVEKEMEGKRDIKVCEAKRNGCNTAVCQKLDSLHELVRDMSERLNRHLNGHGYTQKD